MLAMTMVIGIVFLVVIAMGLAMVNGGDYDRMSFTFLGILGGFALAICFSALIVS